jgi:serine O-acetyltransferase
MRHAWRADLEHMVMVGSKPRILWRLEASARFLLVPRIRAVWLYRLSQVAARHRAMPLALLLQARALRISGAEISPNATIGPGLCLMHSAGIVIGPDVTIGAGARIHQGVTIGDGRVPGQPTLGDHVTIGAGAWILGGVVVGDRVIVGAGARVTSDVPADSVVLGPPSTVTARRPGTDLRLDSLAPRIPAQRTP